MPADDDLALMPRSVRDKLDRVGIKLHLKQWELLTLEERRQLRDRACDSALEIAAYGAALEELIVARTGRPADRLPPR
ncbi:MAG: nitrate reductase associated protein [Candidatus Binatia bacterium]